MYVERECCQVRPKQHTSIARRFGLLRSLTAIGVALSPLLVLGASVTVVVPGKANLWRATQPASVTTPPEVKGIPIIPETRISINATGAVTNNINNRTPTNGPDGNPSWYPRNNALHPENGMASLYAPGNSVIGVFLGADSPGSTSAPQHLDFHPENNSFNGINYTTLSPALKQPFFLGDGHNDAGQLQHVIVPADATRLFLGSMDSNLYTDNAGQFKVTVTTISADRISPFPRPVEPEQARHHSGSRHSPNCEEVSHHGSHGRWCQHSDRRRLRRARRPFLRCGDGRVHR